jgi:3-deoxy-D-manno-octulosonate 8-phosphate phosphatase (KDO 8-P phosphatase)
VQDEANNPSAADVRLLCIDCDGVLTDGSIQINADGSESKRFHVCDGIAIRAWMAQGNQLAVITARASAALRVRMDELGVETLVEKAKDKGQAIALVSEQLGVSMEQVAFLGDDLADLPALRACGLPMAPANACEEVRELAVWIGTRCGGEGAVREAVEYLLKARGAWTDVVAGHLGAGGRV